MKICAVIAEYNPFHNGHAYLLKRAKEQTGADKLFVIMSGNFTQRGEMAIMNKYVRATHAIKAGADAVIELPTVFATAPAEIFASGAVKLLSCIPDVSMLAFGCENDDVSFINSTAKIMVDEPKSYRQKLKEKLKAGISFVKARTEAVSELNEGDVSSLSQPNNILALEYAKAVHRLNSGISIVPIKRVGAEYKDEELKNDLSSASAIRANLGSTDKKVIKLMRSSVPEFVFEDLKNVKENNFKQLAVYSLYMHSAKELKGIMGCNEGLENSFKAILKDTRDYDCILYKLTSKRYTASRLRRIMLSSFLSISESFIRECLEENLYLKILAVKKDDAENTLSALGAASIPLITRKKDADSLKKTALECFKKDAYANDLTNFLTGENTNENLTLFI